MHPFDEATLAAVPRGEDNPQFSKVLSALAHDLTGGASRAELPPLYSTEGQGDDVLVRFKCFAPWGNWTWYATEYDGASLCFGLVDGHEVEAGYFDLAELQTIRGQWGLRIERDLHWVAKPLADVRKEISARH